MTTKGHGGELVLAGLADQGVDAIFTLSGGHIFPVYDACVKSGVRIVDVRHEQTATFAAEGVAKLTRRPGVAVLTAGPGVTNGVSATTTAHFNGSPLIVLAGRAPQGRWGAGSLQELDHVPIVAPITKSAGTASATADIPAAVRRAVETALTPHRGPVFLDFPLDVLFGEAEAQVPPPVAPRGVEPDPDQVAAAASLVASAERPAVVAGSDVWWEGAWDAVRHLVESLRVPTFANGLGRGCLPADHELAFSRTRLALKEADVVVVVGTPLDFRLSFGSFGSAKVVHVVDSADQRPSHVQPAAFPPVDIAARVCHPDRQVVALLGDGALGFSAMDVDTLVRHGLPVTMVVGNNGIWGLEKHPMRALYGYDVAADLQPGCRYDEVVRALGGAGELVTTAADIGPALRRAFASGVPYLVNVVTDPEVMYARSTTGVLAGRRPVSRSWRSGRLPAPRRPRPRASW